MKVKIILFVVLAITFSLCNAQQVPNAGFEHWTNDVTPTGWTSTENIFGLDTDLFTFKDTIVFFQGSTSIKLVSDSVPGNPQLGVVAAETSFGTFSGSGVTTNLLGIPFTYRPDSLIFEYQYNSPGTDSGRVTLSLTNYANGNTATVLSVKVSIPAQSNWTHFAIPLAQYYDTTTTPDTLIIQFKSSVSTRHAVKGSTLHVDAVSFTYSANSSGQLSANITAGGPTTFCTGDSVILQANLGINYTYQWELNGAPLGGDTSSTLTAKTGGSYTVTIDSAAAIAVSQPVVVTVSNLSVPVSLTGLNDTMCHNAAAITLTGGSPAGGTYSGSGVTAITFTPQSAALGIDTIIYTVLGTGNCSSSGAASATITVVNAAVSLTGLDDTICKTASAITLNGGSPTGGTYSGNGVTGSTFAPQSVTSGTDTIIYTATDANHCTGSASATITVVKAVVSLTGLDDTVCSNANAITLSGGSPAGGTYSGSGVTASTFTPQSANRGSDTILYTATDANHCTGSASATIYVEICGSVNNISAISLSVYPNPATDLLNISSTENLTGFKIGFYDVTGAMIMSQALNESDNIISIARLANGTYIYNITDKESNVVFQSKCTVIK